MIEIPLRNAAGDVVAHALIDDVDEPLTVRRCYRLAGGYVVRTGQVDGRRYMAYLHREVTGAARGAVVDHIDGNKLDNRRSNLRVGTHALNAQNQPPRDRPLPRNVYLVDGAYRAQCKIGGVVHALGHFDTVAEADAVASAWRREHMPWSADARLSA